MKKLNSLFVIMVALLIVSCSMSAKTENKETPKESNETTSKGEVITLNKADFLKKVFDYETNQDKWVYAGNKPCIVDFYADWCGPCKKIAPVLKDLAILYQNDIVIYKVNVDNERELASAFGIQSIPTLLFIPQEGQPQISQGALSREEFIKQIDGFLLGKK